MSELADDPGVKYEKGVSPVLIWIEHPSADYYVCEQDSCGGESGYAHSMSPGPKSDVSAANQQHLPPRE
jgi:hypothetical protein